MERLLFVMTLRPGMEAEYERRHEAVWPALLGDLYAAGFRNYSLFRRDLQVYGYAECHPTVSAALDAMGGSTANAEWSRWFDDVIAELTEPDGSLRRAWECWHLDEDAAAAAANRRIAEGPLTPPQGLH